MYHLTFMTGPRKGRRVAVAGHALVIGRHPDCQLVLADDENVAEQQAVIEPRAQGCVLTDLGGPSATLVNGTSVRGSIQLRHRDQIEIGRALLLFSVPGRGAGVGQRRPAGVLQLIAAAAMILFLAAQFVFIAKIETLLAAPLPYRPPQTAPPVDNQKLAPPTDQPPAPMASPELGKPTKPSPKNMVEKPVASAPAGTPAAQLSGTNLFSDAYEMLKWARMLESRGYFEAAHKRLTLIEKMAPGYWPVYAERALLYEKEGRLQDASSEWLRALSYAEDPVRKRELIRRMSELQIKMRGGATAPDQLRLR